MSILALGLPVEAAGPLAYAVAGAASSAARPLIGLGIFAALLLLFKPLLVGFMRAALLVISPRKPLTERKNRQRVQSVLMLHRMARDLDRSQPGLAAELRGFASRD